MNIHNHYILQIINISSYIINNKYIAFLTNRIYAKEKNEPELCKKSKELKLKTKLLLNIKI